MIADSDDRLSELPDALILVILSLLPVQDVVATTLLSKRWLHLWTTTPSLHFWSRSDNFRTLVSSALARWKGSKILKFSLDFLFDLPLTTDLDPWLLFAMEKQVEELYLNVSNSEREYYAPHLPRSQSCP